MILSMDEAISGNAGAAVGVFEVGSLNEFLARTTARARPLFGDLWLEGELSVMFAEAGCGKSLLAMQIADGIARGAALKPLDTPARRQKVIYVDLESPPEQIRARYSYDDESRRSRPYKFPVNLTYSGQGGAGNAGIADIERMVTTNGAKVLIIDADMRRQAFVALSS